MWCYRRGESTPKLASRRRNPKGAGEFRPQTALRLVNDVQRHRLPRRALSEPRQTPARDHVHSSDRLQALIHSLRSRQFRNLEDSSVDFGAGWSLVVGDNGAGKTSLLEALYLAATSKSFLSHKLIDCCRRGTDSFMAEIETEHEARARLRLAWSRDDGVRRSVNDSSSELLPYLEVQPILAYTARDAGLLDGAPAARRRFLDSNLVNHRPPTIRLLARVRALVEAKRAALAQGQPIGPWNELLVPEVLDLQTRRQQLIEDLERRTQTMLEELGLGERKPRLEYLPSRPGDDWDGEDAEAALLAELNRRREDERDCGYPLWGPQRDDWRWSWAADGVEVKRRASRGEKKVLTIALFAACARLLVESGRQVTLLIDDLDAELDRRRRRQLCSQVAGLPQVVATSSRPDDWTEDVFGVTHAVADGRVGPA